MWEQPLVIDCWVNVSVCLLCSWEDVACLVWGSGCPSNRLRSPLSLCPFPRSLLPICCWSLGASPWWQVSWAAWAPWRSSGACWWRWGHLAIAGLHYNRNKSEMQEQSEIYSCITTFICHSCTLEWQYSGVYKTHTLHTFCYAATT